MWNFVQSLKLHYQNNLHQSLQITRNQSFFTVNSVPQSKGIRQVYSTEFLNAATIRKAKLDYIWLLFAKNYAVRITELRKLRTITTPSKKKPHKLSEPATKYSIESTYIDLPCDLKVNRGKLALINRPWKCKKGKSPRSPLVHSRELAEHDNFTRAISRRYHHHGQK